MSETWKHPEQRDDEVYLGNFDNFGYAIIGWRTKRMGNVAYRDDGNLLNDKNLFPVFKDIKETSIR